MLKQKKWMGPAFRLDASSRFYPTPPGPSSVAQRPPVFSLSVLLARLLLFFRCRYSGSTPSFLLILPFLLTLISQTAFLQEPSHDKVFFANSPMTGSYFYSEVEYTSPSWIKNISGKLPVSSKNFTPPHSLEIQYSSAENGTWQARIIYNSIRGIDNFKPASHFVFWLLIASETTVDDLPEIALSNHEEDPEKFLSLANYSGEYFQNAWMRIIIPLKDLTEMHNEIEKLNVVTFRKHGGDGKEHQLYVDQMELFAEQEGDIKALPELVSAKGYEKHVDIVWTPVKDENVKYVKVYRSTDGKSFYPVGIQRPQINRYADFTDTVDAEFHYRISFIDYQYKETSHSEALCAVTKNMSDEELLDMVQQAHFRYYWEGAESNSGLAKENIPGRQNMIASGASGFGIMALLVGVERNFITREQAVDRFIRITTFLEKADKFHGAFSHFIDGHTGKVEPFFGLRDNGGDLVETSFLLQGLLAAQQYFDRNNKKERTIRDCIQKIWKDVEWDWYRKDSDSKFLFWHWSPDKEWTINHKLIGWNETMITYLLAIASPTHPVPASMYYSGWASQSEEAQQYRQNWGNTTDGNRYANGKSYYGIPLDVGVSNGGPLFFIHYSYLGPDPRKIEDTYTNYFVNNRNIALINYRYCIENPGKHQGYGHNCWGLTASDGPWNYSASEPVLHMDDGKMTPTGALASFPYTPEESMAALKNYYRNYGRFLWSEYGFLDAFNLDENWCSEIYMGLNQAPIVVMIENYRSGLIWNLFMKNTDIQKALIKIKTKE